MTVSMHEWTFKEGKPKYNTINRNVNEGMPGRHCSTCQCPQILFELASSNIARFLLFFVLPFLSETVASRSNGGRFDGLIIRTQVRFHRRFGRAARRLLTVIGVDFLCLVRRTTGKMFVSPLRLELGLELGFLRTHGQNGPKILRLSPRQTRKWWAQPKNEFF